MIIMPTKGDNFWECEEFYLIELWLSFSQWVSFIWLWSDLILDNYWFMFDGVFIKYWVFYYWSDLWSMEFNQWAFEFVCNLRLPKYATKFIEMCLMVTADHGPAVSGAHNTIVCARAGKDLVSCLASGLLTIVRQHKYIYIYILSQNTVHKLYWMFMQKLCQ